jgi:hypothetical protein
VRLDPQDRRGLKPKDKHAAVVEKKGSALAITEQKSTHMEVEP